MAAIVDAAKRGVSVRDCTLYTTTFPCHECARRILARDFAAWCTLSPYAKSLASRLHEDAISVDSAIEIEGMVSFEPFVGLSPLLLQRTVYYGGGSKDGGWLRRPVEPGPSIAAAF